MYINCTSLTDHNEIHFLTSQLTVHLCTCAVSSFAAFSITM